MRAVAPLALVSALLAGCFSSQHTATDRGPPSVPPADVAVVRNWSILLDDGLTDAASRLFAVPAIAQNGGPPMRLNSYRAVRSFNDSLPCGARLARTFARGPYVVAVFALTDRPGHDCGIDYGHEAATEFLIRDGHIAEWRAFNRPIPDG